MRSLILFIMVSLDGYFEGPDHDLSWHVVDQEFNEFAVEQLKQIGSLLFGRVTYQLFEDFWPKAETDPKMSKEDLEIARMINTMDKVVFSRTLPSVREREHWKSVRLLREVKQEEIKRLKRDARHDIGVFGSNNLATDLLGKGLIDELRIMVNPVAIGNGNALFNGLKGNVKLKLMRTRTFTSGNVLHYYQLAKK
jgi:dihydrofolate reductase